MSEQQQKAKCFCPYCDQELGPEASLFCKPCRVVLRRCVKCLVVVEANVKVCPQCGQDLG
jgi:RNA polymerase subunit RPABC4/transcription elongation factor Spt4